MEVEQHRFVEEPVNTSFGVAPALAGSSRERSKGSRRVRLLQGKELARRPELQVSRARLYKVLAGGPKMPAHGGEGRSQGKRAGAARKKFLNAGGRKRPKYLRSQLRWRTH